MIWAENLIIPQGRKGIRAYFKTNPLQVLERAMEWPAISARKLLNNI